MVDRLILVPRSRATIDKSLKMPPYVITDHLTYLTSLKNIPNIDFGR